MERIFQGIYRDREAKCKLSTTRVKSPTRIKFERWRSFALEIAKKVASASPINRSTAEDFAVQAFKIFPSEWKRITAAIEEVGRMATSKVKM